MTGIIAGMVCYFWYISSSWVWSCPLPLFSSVIVYVWLQLNLSHCWYSRFGGMVLVKGTTEWCGVLEFSWCPPPSPNSKARTQGAQTCPIDANNIFNTIWSKRSRSFPIQVFVDKEIHNSFYPPFIDGSWMDAMNELGIPRLISLSCPSPSPSLPASLPASLPSQADRIIQPDCSV